VGGDHYVSSTADSGAGSLRAAIASAVSGDTINFAVTGKITLTSGALLVNKNLTILGPGPNSLAVDGNNTSGVFRIQPGRNVTIAGLTITKGYASQDGGGIYNDQATLSVSNSILSQNSAQGYGGAIYNNKGRLTFLSTTLSSNSAAGSAAAFTTAA